MLKCAHSGAHTSMLATFINTFNYSKLINIIKIFIETNFINITVKIRLMKKGVTFHLYICMG